MTNLERLRTMDTDAQASILLHDDFFYEEIESDYTAPDGTVFEKEADAHAYTKNMLRARPLKELSAKETAELLLKAGRDEDSFLPRYQMPDNSFVLGKKKALAKVLSYLFQTYCPGTNNWW